jgi:hypothetical protein
MNSFTTQDEGETLVFNFDITPPTRDDQPDSATLFASLTEQAENPESALRNGVVTSGISSIDESDRVVDETYFEYTAEDDEDDEEVATTSTPGFIIGVSVAAAVIGLGLIVLVLKTRKSTKVVSSFDRSKQQENGESAAGIPVAKDLEAGAPIVPGAPSEKVWTFNKGPAASN